MSPNPESNQRCDRPEGLCLRLPVNVLSGKQLQQLSPVALAYLGDAVYELYIRAACLLPPKRAKLYHNQVVSKVRAESQAETLRSLEPHLTNHELEILRRGRNAATGGPKRINAEIYRKATSLETLMGYLYLSDPERLSELFDLLGGEDVTTEASVEKP